MSDILNIEHHESVEEFRQNLEEMLPEVCTYILLEMCMCVCVYMVVTSRWRHIIMQVALSPHVLCYVDMRATSRWRH